MSILLLVACLTVVEAGELPASVEGLVEAVELANSGDRKRAIATLDGVLKRDPDLIDAHVLRGINRYMLGDMPGAREDLGWAFSKDRWQQIETTSESFQEVRTETLTVDLVDSRISGVAMLVMIEARAGDTAAGRSVLTRGREVFGNALRLRAAEARLLLAEGEPEAAWRALDEAVTTPDETGFVASVASELVALDPSRAPPDLIDSLAAAGQWTAVFNRGRGLLVEGRAGSCADVVSEGLLLFDHPKLLALGYSCAASSDLERADAWLEQLGGPGRAAPGDVVSHARTRIAGGRHADAVALLSDLPRKLPDDVARSRRILELEALLVLGRLDDAARLCDGTVPASDARVAHALVMAKRVPEARKILERACHAMGADPGKAACDHLLAWTLTQ